MEKMRGKSGLALGLAIGYVFGTKAGRERYEQLSQSARRLAADPSLQRLQTEVSGLFSASRQQLGATVEGTATKAAEKVEEARPPAGTTSTTGNSTARTRTSRSGGGGRSSSSRSSGKSGES
jgi:hypothetical protein